ncbi:MAG: YMGG-like glycine zipper-containing protein, partial [Candidatus Acidiferrales bacterium]
VPAPAPAPQAAPAPAPPQPVQLQVPAGSTITIRMIDSVDSSVNQPGEIFHASLDQPLVVGDRVAVPKGADVYVRLTSASSAGRVTGTSELRLELVKLEFQGQSYPLVSSTYSLNGASRGKDTAKKVGVGAVLGTLIGAIAGGGKGAAIGAGAGAAGGGVYQGSTHGQQVRIPSETKLDFQLEQPVSVTVMPPMNSQ